MKAVQLQQVRVVDIVPTTDNQRKNIEKEEGFAEFVASIKGGGVRIPVHVIPVSGGKGIFELRAGERRYRAAIAAGLKTIPAIVHTGLDDSDAIDLTFIENKFRKDLAPMEEAAEIELLAGRFGGDVKAIAGRIGHSERWVRMRTNINASLVKPWKKAVENDLRYRNWTVTHLTLIARLPAGRQKQLLEDMGDYYPGPDLMSASDLKDFIGKGMKLLSKAGWDLADETLVPKAGACSKCEKRSGHQPMLWFDSDDQVDAGDQCMDGVCWQAKQMALLQRTAAGLREKHPDLVYISKEYPDRQQAGAISESLGSYISQWDYETCSKSAKGAVPAMYVFGKSAGKLAYVTINKTGGSGQAGKTKGVPTPLKVRRAMLDAKRWSQVLIDLRAKVAKTAVDEITYDDKVTGVMALVALCGNKKPYDAWKNAEYKEIEKLLKSGRKNVLARLFETLKPTLDDLLTYNGPITQTPKRLIERAEWIGKLIGSDTGSMFKDVSGRKGFTEPKSWSGLNADGTEKKDKKKVKKQKSGVRIQDSEKEKDLTTKSTKGTKKSKKAKGKKNDKKIVIGTCRVCGCTDDKACIGADGEACHWAEKDLCSNCKDI